MDTDTRRRLLTTGGWRGYVEDEARSWKGTPYQHKGRVKGVGADCGGMIYEVFRQLLPLPPFPKHYAPDWAIHRENEIYLSFIEPYVTQVKRRVPGGLAMFKIGRNFSHAAICTTNGKFIHAWGRNQAGSVIESGLSFFMVGGKPREVLYYDLSDACLNMYSP